MSAMTTISRRRDVFGPVAERILREMEEAFGFNATHGPVELRLTRDGAGQLVAATLTTQHRVEAIPATESDAAWAARRAS